MFLKISGGIARLLSPWLRDHQARLVSITYKSGSQTFMSRAPLQKTLNTCGRCSSIKIPSFGGCLWPLLGLCTWSQRTVPWPPRGTRAPFQKLWLRNKSCKRLGSRPKRSIKPCYTNRTTKQTCMWTRLRTNVLQLEHHAGFAKLTRWIMKTRHSKYSFALSIHSDVRTKP